MKTIIEPKISIVMPVYNSSEFLQETLDSILNQTFADFELICVDDCSTDNSLEILKENAEQDSRIKIFRNDKNKGAGETANNAFSKVNKNSKYVLRADSDDICRPNRFQKQFDFMEENKEVDIAGSWYQCFGAKNKLFKHPTSHNEIKIALLSGSVIAQPTVIFRNSFLQKNNIKYSTYRVSEDYDLWTKSLFEHNAILANIPEALILYRVHPKQLTAGSSKDFFKTSKDIQNYVWQNLSLKEKFISQLDFTKIRRWIIRIKFNKNEKIIRLFGVYLLNK